MPEIVHPLDKFLRRKTKAHICKYVWPEHIKWQYGGDGVVISSTGNYNTAFFEIFSSKDDIYFERGEGKTIDEAEEECWKKYHKRIGCVGHEFEARGYENGGGFCKHCNMFKGDAIKPIHKCEFCPEKTWFYKKSKDPIQFVCEDCFYYHAVYEDLPFSETHRQIAINKGYIKEFKDDQKF